VFALSFGFVGLSIVDKLKPILTGATVIVPDAITWLINIEMVTMFIITAGVFYHQSVKFLDIRYAKRPLSVAGPGGFAFDYLALVLTAAPFYLMAHALSPRSHTKSGICGSFWRTSI
jgi:hypothetical protein